MGVKCTRTVHFERNLKGVANVDVEYAKSTDNMVAPTTGWQTEAPKWEQGKYIWQRVRTEYTDATVEYSKPVCVTGSAGNTGVGVASVREQYYMSTSYKSLLGGTWSATYPGWAENRYLWTRTVIVYTDDTVDYTAAICVSGMPGATGTAQSLYTWIKYADNPNGDGMSDDPVTESGEFKAYIGFAYNKTTATESTNPDDYKWTLFKGTDGANGIDGADGKDGKDGKDGVTTYTWIKYADALNEQTGYPSSIYDVPKDSTRYIGIAVNQTSAIESIVPSRYSWSKFRGDDGTSFSVNGNAFGHFDSLAEYYKAINQGKVEQDENYLVDIVGGTASVCVWNGAGSTQDAMESGIAYIIESDGHLWVSKGDVWIDLGTIQGPQGPGGRDGNDGVDGADGEDALCIMVSNDNVVYTDVIGQEAKIYVEVLKGEEKLVYNTDYTCSTLGSQSLICDGCIYWTFKLEDGRFCYRLLLAAKFEGVKTIPFTITRGGKTYSRTINLRIAKNGEKGDRGPALRGPQQWDNCNTGYAFQQGGTGEGYKDVVIYRDNYYSCKKSHNKTNANYPTSTEDNNNGYWQLADKVEIIATNILLSTYALIKNLGVEAIEMTDDNGNVLFEAKAGNVTCNTGTFQNIVVKGNSTFEGQLKAVTGSFRSLNCVDASGKVICTISLSDSGFTFGSGDMYHQGTKDGRSLRFYTSNLYCRGLFGARERSVLIVLGSYGYYFPNGIPSTATASNYTNYGVYVSFTSKTSSANVNYYILPLYAEVSGATGMPVDEVWFRINSSTTYTYELQMAVSQRTRLINLNNSYNNVRFFDNGDTRTLDGGETVEVTKIHNLLMLPAKANTVLGGGIICGSFRDNDWK